MKYDLHALREYCMSLVAHSRSGVGFLIFILNCSMDICFVPYPHGTIFHYFYQAFYTFDSITPFNSNLTKKILIFAGFILVALFHPAFIWY